MFRASKDENIADWSSNFFRLCHVARMLNTSTRIVPMQSFELNWMQSFQYHQKRFVELNLGFLWFPISEMDHTSYLTTSSLIIDARLTINVEITCLKKFRTILSIFYQKLYHYQNLSMDSYMLLLCWSLYKISAVNEHCQSSQIYYRFTFKTNIYIKVLKNRTDHAINKNAINVTKMMS